MKYINMKYEIYKYMKYINIWNIAQFWLVGGQHALKTMILCHP